MQSKRVFVGLSGGVDSAVSAALLQRAGYEVTGVFIKIWQPEFLECTWREDRLDAMRVAAHLKIPFREIDLSDQYKDEVVADMIAAYQSGVTPNPDILCNERIKFGHFLRYALAQRADHVATGHYAQITERRGAYLLRRGADAQKDQSYFLARLGQSELSRALFPVGGFDKSAVRALAREFQLPVAQKSDSQGLCFVGAVSIPEFLGRYITLMQGDVLDPKGEVIGQHDGAALFTIGQRHGFRVSGGMPLYVTKVDVERNTISVAEEPHTAAVQKANLCDVRWNELQEGQTLLIQTRYREAPASGVVVGNTVTFEKPHVASPGQTAVFYDGDVSVGCAVLA